MTRKIAFLSMDHLEEDMACSDDMVIPHLLGLGFHEVDTISWRHRDAMNQEYWNAYEMVVIRSTWDYQQDPESFLQVLSQIEASSAQLENSIQVVRWNTDKIYLKQLEKDMGVPVIPTIWKDRLDRNNHETSLTREDLEDYFDLWNTDQLVLKPRISASSDNTFCIHRNDNNEDGWTTSSTIQSAMATRDFMIQPFIPAIVEEGEYSMFYFGGTLSHVIVKKPANGDFRVQEEYGGRHCLVEQPPKELVKAAETSMSALDNIFRGQRPPLYARLDLVRHHDGCFVLMEFELIEPSLYFNLDPSSPKRFAQAIMDRLVDTNDTAAAAAAATK